MKLTEPPFATASINISLSIAQISGEDFKCSDLDIRHEYGSGRMK